MLATMPIAFRIEDGCNALDTFKPNKCLCWLVYIAKGCSMSTLACVFPIDRNLAPYKRFKSSPSCNNFVNTQFSSARFIDVVSARATLAARGPVLKIALAWSVCW